MLLFKKAFLLCLLPLLKKKKVYILTPNQYQKLGSEINLAFISLALIFRTLSQGKRHQYKKEKREKRLVIMPTYFGTMSWSNRVALKASRPILKAKEEEKLFHAFCGMIFNQQVLKLWLIATIKLCPILCHHLIQNAFQ